MKNNARRIGPSRPARSLVLFTLLAALAILTPTAFALAIDADQSDLYMRVVDVGAGQCCVIRIPAPDPDDNHYIVYDLGNFVDKGKTAFAAIEEIIPEGESIDLVVMSHTDSDHTAALPKVVEKYHIHRILRTGMTRFGNFPATLRNARDAVKKAVEEENAVDLDLKTIEFPPGATYRLGDAFVSMIAGFGENPDDWSVSGNSEKNNAPSIVLRVAFKGKSILLCGDAVGRHIGADDDDDPIASEKFIIEMAAALKIDSDVLVAPHHGADNGSSTQFIEAVSPSHVIFCAGHKHDHPRASVAQRYIDQGIAVANMFRTDLGDDEGQKEWSEGRIPGHTDKKGDDDIEVVIKANGDLLVDYASPTD